MNKLINIILSGLLWRRYKFLICSLIVLIVFVWLVGNIHQDYLEYLQTINQQSGVALSFVIKWAVYCLGVAVFFFSNHWVNGSKERKALKNTRNKSLFSIVKSKISSTPNGDSSSDELDTNSKAENDSSDPFAEIRTKKKLRSYAELLVDDKLNK